MYINQTFLCPIFGILKVSISNVPKEVQVHTSSECLMYNAFISTKFSYEMFIKFMQNACSIHRYLTSGNEKP